MKIAFYKGTLPGWRGWVSRLIRFTERGRYSHCEVVFSDGLCASASWYDGGIRFKRIDFNPEHWDFVEVPWADEAAAHAWFSEHLLCGYDLKGSLGILFRPVRHHGGRWFCSEAAAAALGVPQAWRFGPNALAAMLGAEKW